jgi:hypothetical protein
VPPSAEQPPNRRHVQARLQLRQHALGADDADLDRQGHLNQRFDLHVLADQVLDDVLPDLRRAEYVAHLGLTRVVARGLSRRQMAVSSMVAR